MLNIVIDTSYFVFHRFFATLRWYSLREPEKIELHVGGGTITDDPDFMKAFFRFFENDLKKLRHKHTYVAPIWMACDCSRSDIWRCEIYPEYKATRIHGSTFDGGIFPKVYEYLNAEATRLNLIVLKHPCLEADDICYILYKHLEYSKLVIIANDNDYLQLCSDMVEVINKEGKYIKERGCGDASKDLLRKILTGDKSDNIPPICRGMGPKTADKLIAMTEEERNAWIHNKGDAAVAQYDINRRLVDMRHIPVNLITEVVANIDAVP
jgi:5'-3' exonuclease